MAIYHASVKVIGRSAGRSATAAAAYRSGAKIEDERTGLTHDYTRRSGVDASGILAPKNAPAWATDRAALWNAVELAEKRKDAQLAREIELAIPVELERDQGMALVADFVKRECVSLGMVADVCFHDLDSGNPHAHVLLTMRTIGANGFGQKNRDWNAKTLLQRWREQWQNCANKALAEAGRSERIDHRTLQEQGIQRVPTIHEGPAARRMVSRGQQADRVSHNLRVVAFNNKAAELLEKQRQHIRRIENRPRRVDRDRLIVEARNLLPKYQQKVAALQQQLATPTPKKVRGWLLDDVVRERTEFARQQAQKHDAYSVGKFSRILNPAAWWHKLTLADRASAAARVAAAYKAAAERGKLPADAPELRRVQRELDEAVARYKRAQVAQKQLPELQQKLAVLERRAAALTAPEAEKLRAIKAEKTVQKPVKKPAGLTGPGM